MGLLREKTVARRKELSSPAFVSRKLAYFGGQPTTLSIKIYFWPSLASGPASRRFTLTFYL